MLVISLNFGILKSLLQTIDFFTESGYNAVSRNKQDFLEKNVLVHAIFLRTVHMFYYFFKEIKNSE